MTTATPQKPYIKTWPCIWCGANVMWISEKGGFVHQETGEAYTKECTKCEWKGGKDACPNCLTAEHLVEDHYAFPTNE